MVFKIEKKTVYNELCETESTYYVVRYKRNSQWFWRSVTRVVGGGCGDVFDEVIRFNTVDDAVAVIDRMKLGIVPNSIKTEVIHENIRNCV
jgi:hypothetical protein